MKVCSRKFVSSLAALTLLAMMLIFSTGCGSSAQSAGKYIAGTYTGEGTGMGGKIEVTLTVDNESIVSVDKITDPGETAGVGGKEAIADGTFTSQIIEAQSGDIDGVSGATMTSDGVKKAVNDALGQAANEA